MEEPKEAINNNKSAKPKKRSVDNKKAAKPAKEGLSYYRRKRAITHLQQNGCTPEQLQKIAAASKGDREAVLEYVKALSVKGEALGNMMCDGAFPNHVNQWLNLLKEAELTKECDYSAAGLMNVIVNHEEQPKPNELNGIDLAQAYKFIELSLMGQPQIALNKQTDNFLLQEFKLLRDEIKSGKAAEEIDKMKAILEVIDGENSEESDFEMEEISEPISNGLKASDEAQRMKETSESISNNVNTERAADELQKMNKETSNDVNSNNTGVDNQNKEQISEISDDSEDNSEDDPDDKKDDKDSKDKFKKCAYGLDPFLFDLFE